MNKCLICDKPVGENTGLQCHNKCEHFVHYLCLGCDNATIKGIKAGAFAVLCACKKCVFGKETQANFDVDDDEDISTKCFNLLPSINFKKKGKLTVEKNTLSKKCYQENEDNQEEVEEEQDDKEDDESCTGTVISIDISRSVTEEKHCSKNYKKPLCKKFGRCEKSLPCEKPLPCAKPAPCQRPPSCGKPTCERLPPCQSCQKTPPCKKPLCVIPIACTKPLLHEKQEDESNEDLDINEEEQVGKDKSCQCTGSVTLEILLEDGEPDSKSQHNRKKECSKTKKTKPACKTTKKVEPPKMDKKSVHSSESTMFVRPKQTDQSLIDVLESVCHTVKQLHLQIRQLMCRVIAKDGTKNKMDQIV